MSVESGNSIDLLEYVLSAVASPAFLASALACFVYGTIPFAYLFPLLLKGRRISAEGSGNVGIANAFGVGGLPAGFLAVAGEASKVALPIVLVRLFLDGSLPLILILVFLVLLATNYSPIAGGRAGQGGTIVLWTLLLLSPLVLLAFLVGFVAIFLITRNRQLTNLLGHAALPLEMYVLGNEWSFIVFGALAAVLLMVRYDRKHSDYSYYKGSMRLLGFIERRFVTRDRFILSIDDAGDHSRVGSKAAGLSYLHRHGLKIPRTWVCGFDAYDAFVQGNEEILSSIERELERAIPCDARYCVRSSANLEDSSDASFAGQFETRLNLESVPEILEAIQCVWKSPSAARVEQYARRVGLSTGQLRMGCVIQERVGAKLSGVVFTRNPLNGLDEIVIEAVAGLGDALVQVGVTPDRWVYKWGAWKERPPGKDDQLETIKQIVKDSRLIAMKRGRPLDLEWSFDGRELYWLQVREITGLGGLNIYSNRIAKEFLPGLVKPLVWSINIPTVNTSWKKLLVEAIGKDARGIDISGLAKPFHYHAYFNMGVLGDIFELVGMPRESLELVLGIEVPSGERPKMRPSMRSLKHVPRLGVFLLRMATVSRKIERTLSAYRPAIAAMASEDVQRLDREGVVKAIREVQRKCVDLSYYLIIAQVLTGVYSHLLSRALARVGVEAYQLSFAETRRTLKHIDPAQHLSDLQREYSRLPSGAKQSLETTGASALAQLEEAQEFAVHYRQFLGEFGHLSDSGNDFSRRSWRETPDLVLEMISSQRPMNPPSGEAGDLRAMSGKWPRQLRQRYLYRRVARWRACREEVSALYVLGYSLFRRHFLRLGSLLAEAGDLGDPEDIFYLTWDEVTLLASGEALSSAPRDLVAYRRQEMAACEGMQMPEVIVGDSPPPRTVGIRVAKSLLGVPASRGHSVGPACVVGSLEDSARLRQGDILVIPFSDVSWTPLISRASAVVSEAGGLLSHCAIVAREYGIPAVVSVAGAMRLPDGVRIAVDGNRGEIAVLGEAE